jgi:putative lipoic acid-binding regulatory protein
MVKNMKNFEQLKKLLDQEYTWPAYYPFRFITKKDQKDELLRIFPKDHPVVFRPSRKGNYLGIHIDYMASSSDEVILIYEKMTKLTGVMSL